MFERKHKPEPSNSHTKAEPFVRPTVQAMLKKESEKTAYLTNNSSHTIYYKPENGSGLGTLAPGGILYEQIDGAATAKYKDAVIKIPTGASLTVTSEGGGDIDFYGLGGLSRMVGYGWITAVPDANWQPLFDKAKEIGKTNYKKKSTTPSNDFDPWQFKPSRDLNKI